MSSLIEDEDYRGKNPSSGRMGKAAEYLVAASCILATRGELNVSTSMVDDEGIDLIFHRRGAPATLAVQVKARMSDAVVVQKQKVTAQVREQTFRPRENLDMLFVAIDIERGAIMTAWLVPSTAFESMVTGRTTRGRMRFSASMKQDAADRWSPYRLTATELPKRIMARLGELESARAGKTE